MLQVNAKDLAIGVLNTILEMDDLDMEVHGRLCTVLALLDSQPEEDFYGAVSEAYRVMGVSADRIENIIKEFKNKLDTE